MTPRNPGSCIRAEGTPPDAPNKVAFFKLTDMADVGLWRFAAFDRLLTNVRFCGNTRRIAHCHLFYRPHRPSSEWQVGFGLPQLASSSAGNFETPVYYPDPDMVREELHRILAEARAAKTIPWDANRTALYRAIFPQMTGCLPEDEGAQLRFDFETEMARLEAA